jgi:hypothetical protein
MEWKRTTLKIIFAEWRLLMTDMWANKNGNWQAITTHADGYKINSLIFALTIG